MNGNKPHILNLKHIAPFFKFKGEMSRRFGDAARYESGVRQGAGTHRGIFHRLTRRFVKHATFHRNSGKGTLDTKQKCQNEKDIFFHKWLFLLKKCAKLGFFGQNYFGFVGQNELIMGQLDKMLLYKPENTQKSRATTSLTLLPAMPQNIRSEINRLAECVRRGSIGIGHIESWTMKRACTH